VPNVEKVRQSVVRFDGVHKYMDMLDTVKIFGCEEFSGLVLAHFLRPFLEGKVSPWIAC